MEGSLEKSKSKSKWFIPFFYASIIALSLNFYEIVLYLQLGDVEPANLFFLFFIPAEAVLLAVLCGIGNRLSSMITFPIVLFVTSVFYIVQTVYITNFGTLFSVSMAAMGTSALGDFGWALTDSIVQSIPRIIVLLIPTIITVLFISIKPLRQLINRVSDGQIAVLPYKWYVHFIMLALAVALWFAGIGGIRLFGAQRPSPYYLMTSTSVTTDAAAHKLGALTTAIVEAQSYFVYREDTTDELVLCEEEDFIEPVAEIPEDEIQVIHVEDDADSVVEQKTVEKVPQIKEGLDFDEVARWSEDDDETAYSIAQFMANRKPSTTNDYTGMFEGYNLIYICAESFWNYACNSQVTPTLYMMANNGIVLDNYYNSFFNTTTNGEFALCTGLWPDVSRNSKNGTDVGSFAQSASKYMPQGLGDLFTDQGIPSYAFHNYYGKYYRRILSWPNLGYTCRFTGDNMWFTSNWPASDLELMEQTVDDYINDPQFNVYYMTFSGHGPFTAKNYMYNKNIDEVTSILGEDRYNIDARGYFCGELELDKAMEYLLDRLEKAGKLDNTVIVIAGDHYPYYLSKEGLSSLTGNDETDMNFDIYKSSCIIYNAGMKEPLKVEDYCSNVDIAPTILNLFNIPFESRLFMGRDIFSDEAHKRATLYNMNFISDKVRYNYEKGEAVWTVEGDEMTDIEKDRYLDAQLASIENEYNVSCKMISGNFFLKAYEACGLLSPEELEAEKARESAVIAKDESFNFADEVEEMEREMEEQQEIDAQQIMDMMNGQIPVDGLTDPAAVPGALTAPDGGAVPDAQMLPENQPVDQGQVQPAENPVQ